MGLRFEAIAPREAPISPDVRLARFLAAEADKTNAELAELQTRVEPGSMVKLGDDCRIQPPENIYEKNNREYIERIDSQMHPTAETERGDHFEQFLTAVLIKRLRGRYIIARTSKYDDYANGVDNVLIDVKTGGVVCALDELSQVGLAANNPRFKAKQKIVNDMNWGMRPTERQRADQNYDRDSRFGAMVKYGLILKPGSPDGQTKASISCGPVTNIPIFLISLDSNHIDDARDAFEEAVGKPGSMEDKLYRYFLGNILLQIKDIKSKHQTGTDFDDLPTIMQSRISDFEAFIVAELGDLNKGGKR